MLDAQHDLSRDGSLRAVLRGAAWPGALLGGAHQIEYSRDCDFCLRPSLFLLAHGPGVAAAMG